jgi:carbon-monoxide dehydrogenase medium subunit
MSAFRYAEPSSVADAVALLDGADADVHLLAGGTALVPLIKTGYVAPSLVVGLRRLAGLRTIERRGGELVIGSLASHGEVAESPLVRSGWPLLAEACGVVGTVRIRNQGTLGGNLVHADPSQDPPPALLVLEATARVVGPAGERRIPMADWFVDIFETSLDPAEILIDLTLPPVPAGSRTAYRKFLPRSKDDYATVAVAGLVRTDAAGQVADVRVALGGAGPRPVRATGVEAALAGALPTPSAIAAAAAEVAAAIDPIDDVRGSAAYKRAMARVWVERTLGDLCGVPVA